MPQGLRIGWLRAAFASVGVTLCVSLLGCNSTDKPSNSTATKAPTPGLPNTATLPPGYGTNPNYPSTTTAPRTGVTATGSGLPTTGSGLPTTGGGLPTTLQNSPAGGYPSATGSSLQSVGGQSSQLGTPGTMSGNNSLSGMNQFGSMNGSSSGVPTGGIQPGLPGTATSPMPNTRVATPSMSGLPITGGLGMPAMPGQYSPSQVGPGSAPLNDPGPIPPSAPNGLGGFGR